MPLFTVLLFAVSCNLDSLVMGLSYGVKKIHIRPLSNLLVSAVTLAGTLLAMGLGRSILPLFPEKSAGALGGVLIVVIGLYSLLSYWRARSLGSQDEPPKTLSPLGLREAGALGLALSVNNAGLGVGASIAGLAILPASLCSFACSLLFLALGNRVGRSRLSDLIGAYAEPLADLIMVALGLYEILA